MCQEPPCNAPSGVALTAETAFIDALTASGCIPTAGLWSWLAPGVTGIGFGIKGLDGRYRVANQALERLLGSGSDHLAGRSEGDFLPPELLAQALRCDQCIVDGAPAASLELPLPANRPGRRCLWLKLPVLAPDQTLQAIASIIHERGPALAEVPTREALASLRQANRQLQRTVDELEQVASTDKLTGTWNRRRLEECVRHEMDRLKRYQQPLSLLLLDIDLFKRINDVHGHNTGDQVLQALGSLLRSRLRGTDSLARWGGEEFVVVCPNTRRETAALLAERVRSEIADSSFPGVGKVTASLGVAECRPEETWEQWFARADQALYRAKKGGRNQVQLAPEAHPALIEEYVVANFVQLVWRPTYECGDERVDRGHRQLFADANELLSAILSGQAAASVDRVVDHLLADVLQHFADEEAVMAAAGFPGIEEHILLHRQLIDQAQQVVAQYRAGDQSVGNVFQFLAYDVVTRHMLGADRQFFPFLDANDGLPSQIRGERRRSEQRRRADGPSAPPLAGQA